MEEGPPAGGRVRSGYIYYMCTMGHSGSVCSSEGCCVCRGDGFERGVIENIPMIQLWGGHLLMLLDKVQGLCGR